MDFTSPHMEQVSAELVSALRKPDSEFPVAIAISRLIDPEINADVLQDRFDNFVAPLLTQHMQTQHAASSVGVTEFLQWFKSAGFGPPQGEVRAMHSNLNYILAEHQGIPISLAMLLLECGRRCHLQGFGINSPGHFLLSLGDQVIDPLGLSIVEPTMLASRGIQPQTLQPATAEMVALRMLNNLKALSLQTHAINDALAIVDVQLAISADQPELAASLHFERGEFWQQLGAVSAARQAFEQCALLCPYPHLAQRALSRAEQLAGGSETWH